MPSKASYRLMPKVFTTKPICPPTFANIGLVSSLIIHNQYGARDVKKRYYGPPSIFRSKSLESGPKVAPISVFTDGSCLGWGSSSKLRAGYGVYFAGEGHENVLACITRKENRNPFIAELLGLNHALVQIGDEIRRLKGKNTIPKYVIHTDLVNAIDEITLRGEKWAQQQWSEPKGKKIEHFKLIKSIVGLYNFINSEYGKYGLGVLDIKHVKSHNGNAGNEAADFLAREGARLQSHE